MQWFLKVAKGIAKRPYLLASGFLSRLRLPLGVNPRSYLWGFDRGLPIHRFYLEEFLREFSGDIRGACLEFLSDDYTTRFAGGEIERLDILHVDKGNPAATLVADLTRPNDIPSEHFDCIVCTHVLNVVANLGTAVTELHRILRPGGTLLVAVPHVSMYDAEAHEIWRFTPGGLAAILEREFGSDQVTVRAYGNSLTAAGEIRGLVSHEFWRSELCFHDPRFAVEVCARAVKV